MKVLIYELRVDDEAHEQAIIAEMESVLGMRPTRIEERNE